MNKTAIAYFTKDRVELSKRAIEPLLQPDKFDLWVFDGSDTPVGEQFVLDSMASDHFCRFNVRGGPDAAVVYALTTMLDYSDVHEPKWNYDYVGLVENDVLLDPGWFGPVRALFDRGRAEGLEVGAVSARAYEDRVLIQRDGYAVMHGLGWGMQIMTRQAAELTLKHFRTCFTTENRRLFARLTGTDIGTYWAFRTNENMLCADWGNDRVLAAHGLASLALTPSPVEMIGQRPPLAEQGLKLVTEPVEARRNDKLFVDYVERTTQIRVGELQIPCPVRFRGDDGTETIFAHQLRTLVGAEFTGEWKLRWVQGFGPFAWQAVEPNASFQCALAGPAEVIVTGGEKGARVQVEDLLSGYIVRPVIPPDVSGQMMQAVLPSGVSWRSVRITALTPGVTLYAIRCREPQPALGGSDFNHSHLPPTG